MSAAKPESTVAHAEESPTGDVATGQHETIMAVNDDLARFQARQHSMTVKEAIKENWKPLLWCKSCLYLPKACPDR